MSNNPCLIYSQELLNYNFGPQHPFNPLRLKLTIDLIKQLNLLKADKFYPPSIALEEEVLKVHDSHYLNAVKRAGKEGRADPQDTQYYELGTEDNPVFENMQEATLLLVGGTLTGAKRIMTGAADHVLNFAGGLHHAARAKASGFCIYNDIAVAIAFFKSQGMRVAYIDIDAHHGDGVQWLFYDDPQVLTVSFHESGKFLFPGSGSLYERGSRGGFGYSLNIPLEPFTEDDSFIEVFDMVVPKVLAEFQPDVIISQHGCDGHEFDPLAHLSLTTRSYIHAAATLHNISHQLCDGRWLATGGGGYDFWRVVPRVWTLLWAEMLEVNSLGPIPTPWLEKYGQHAPVSLPETIEDPPNLFAAKPRRAEIVEKNRLVAEKAMNPQFLLKGDPGQIKAVT